MKKVCKICSLEAQGAKKIDQLFVKKKSSRGHLNLCLLCKTKGKLSLYREERDERIRKTANTCSSASYHKHKEGRREQRKDSNKKYYEANKSKLFASFASAGARRKASKIQRTPSWLTDADFRYMKSLYVTSSIISRLTGIIHHVDHIIPLWKFDLTDWEQVRLAFAPENHRWLTKHKNNRRSKLKRETTC